MVTQFCWISVIFVDLGGLYKISTIWWILQDLARRGPARRLKIEDSTHVIPHADVPSVWRIRVRFWWALRCMCVCVYVIRQCEMHSGRAEFAAFRALFGCDS